MEPKPNSKRPKPEDTELERKHRALEALEVELVERELDLATLRSEIASLEAVFGRVASHRYARLDELHAQLAARMAHKVPLDAERKVVARVARQVAGEGATASEETNGDVHNFIPSKELRQLYREAAKAMHPDLAASEPDRLRREEAMRQVNEAYATGDMARLQNLLADWESSPESVEGEDVGAELVRTIRKIAQAQRRLQAIEQELITIRTTDGYRLREKVALVAAEGRDFIADLGKNLDQEIALLERRLGEAPQGKNR